jgi:hypothetical protein
MNKNEIKEIYMMGAMKNLLKEQVEFYLPANVSQKAIREFRERLNRELAEMEQRAENYATKVTS